MTCATHVGTKTEASALLTYASKSRTHVKNDVARRVHTGGARLQCRPTGWIRYVMLWPHCCRQGSTPIATRLKYSFTTNRTLRYVFPTTAVGPRACGDNCQHANPHSIDEVGNQNILRALSTTRKNFEYRFITDWPNHTGGG